MSTEQPGLLDGAVAPSEQTRLFGHAAAEAFLAQSYRSGKGHHAILIEGPEGIGKATLAFRFARALLAGPGALDQRLALAPDHPVFRQVARGAHPDLTVLEAERDPRTGRLRSEITVDAVRAATGSLQMTPAAGGYRVAIVDGAESMNRNAANALLKTLEEPPARSVLIAGVLLTIVGGAAMLTVGNLLQMHLWWGLVVGLGGGFLTVVLGASVANRWFITRRGLECERLHRCTAAGCGRKRVGPDRGDRHAVLGKDNVAERLAVEDRPAHVEAAVRVQFQIDHVGRERGLRADGDARGEIAAHERGGQQHDARIDVADRLGQRRVVGDVRPGPVPHGRAVVQAREDRARGHPQAALRRLLGQQGRVGGQVAVRAELDPLVAGRRDLVEEPLPGNLPRVVREPDAPGVGRRSDTDSGDTGD